MIMAREALSVPLLLGANASVNSPQPGTQHAASRQDTSASKVSLRGTVFNYSACRCCITL